MRLAAAKLAVSVFAGGQTDNFLRRYVQQRELLLSLAEAIRTFIEVDDHHAIDSRPVDRLVVRGVMQAVIPGAQHRVRDPLLERVGHRFAAAEDKVFIKGVVAVRDAQNRAFAGKLERIGGELMGKSSLFRQIAIVIIAVFFQVVAMITEGAVENILRAEAAGFEQPVDMAIPDRNLIGAGNQRPMLLHHGDGVGDFIRWIIVVIVHTQNVFTLCQRVEHIALFTQSQLFRVVNIANIERLRFPLRQPLNKGQVTLRRVVEDNQLPPVGRIVLVAVHIEQIG